MFDVSSLKERQTDIGAVLNYDLFAVDFKSVYILERVHCDII